MGVVVFMGRKNWWKALLGAWMSCACFGAVSTITGTWGIPCFTIPFCVVTMLVISSGDLEDGDDGSKIKIDDSEEEEEVPESKGEVV